ncbi:MAG: choice-of-anchor S family protein [Candidatus Heimdallarchaeota archaeon]
MSMDKLQQIQNDAGDTSKMLQFLYMPWDLSTGIRSWDQQEVEMGPPLMLDLFFLEPAAFGALFTTLDQQGETPVYTQPSYWTAQENDGYYDDNYKIAFFDWVMNAVYNDTGCNIYFAGSYYVKIAYEQETGILYGFKLKLAYSGYTGSKALSFDIQQRVELKNYNLGKNIFDPSDTIGFSWTIAIPVLLAFGIFTCLRKRQKKEH